MAIYFQCVFDAYGPEFFDDMEDYVNTNPTDFTVNIGQLANIFTNLELSGTPAIDIISSWWMIPIVILLIVWIRGSPKKSKSRRKKNRIKIF